MKQFPGIRLRHNRLPQAFLLAIAVSLSLSSFTLDAAPAAQNGSLEQLQSRLKKDVRTASIKDLERAMTAAVKANPAGAPDYIEAYIKSGRKDAASSEAEGRRDPCEETGRMIAAAIKGLGSNPSVTSISAIVERAVVLESHCAPAIVAAAVKAAPAGFADEIVEIAIASVANPEQMVGKVSMAEAILMAALGARPGLDTALLASAAESGLARNLSQILAIAMPSAQGSQAQGDLNGVPAYQKNPNLAAFLAAERARDRESEASPQ